MGERQGPPQGPTIEEALRFNKDLPAGNVWNRSFSILTKGEDEEDFHSQDLDRISPPLQEVIKVLKDKGIVRAEWEPAEVLVNHFHRLISVVFTKPSSEDTRLALEPPPLEEFICQNRVVRRDDSVRVKETIESVLDKALKETNLKVIEVHEEFNHFRVSIPDGCLRLRRTSLEVHQPGVGCFSIHFTDLNNLIRGLDWAIGSKEEILEKARLILGREGEIREEIQRLYQEKSSLENRKVKNPQRLHPLTPVR